MYSQLAAKTLKQKLDIGKRVLVAIDGSVYSTNALHYLAKLFQNVHNVEITLFSIVTHKVHDTQRAWIDEKNIKPTLDPVSKKSYSSAEECMSQAKDLLTRHGMHEEQINCYIRMTRRNVTEDLLHEARSGLYDALLIGRRGLGMIQELVAGSISKAILQKCHDVPIWLIDGIVNPAKFLLPIDGTIHSLRAVDHLAFILQDNPNTEITLFNTPALFGDKPVLPPEEGYAAWGKKWCDEHLAHPDCLFHTPTQILVDNGFPRKRINHLCSHIGLYASRQIVRQALIDDFGTIVMGRRPDDSQKGIFGGVTDKVIHMADQVAIWIVG